MKLLITLFVLSLALGLNGCGHRGLGPVVGQERFRPILQNIGAISLGPRLEREEMDNVIMHTLLKWEEQFPYEMRSFVEIEVELQLHPIAIVFTPREIICNGRAQATQFQGEIPLCDGIWYIGSRHLIVNLGDDLTLACSALAHELSHLVSYALFGDADSLHANPLVWNNIVKEIQVNCPN